MDLGSAPQRRGNLSPVIDISFPALLRERASLQPDDLAFTFIDYDADWDGSEASLTWPQLYRRVLNVASELRTCTSPGDRAAIVAPQSLEYVVAFLGAMQAGLIAVPLSVPAGGVADERVDSVLWDCKPAAVLTTSSVVDDVVRRITAQSTDLTPAIIEIDRLDLDASVRVDQQRTYEQTTAYLQYTSGSTRSPTGVEVSYDNMMVNYQVTMRGFFQKSGGVEPPEHTIVLWLPFYHDLGLIMGVCTPVLSGCSAVLTSPMAFLQRPARWMQMLSAYPDASTGAPNFAFELAARKTTDEDLDGCDFSRVSTIISGAERVRPDTLKRFATRFARFNLREEVLRPTYGLAESTLYVATTSEGRPPGVAHFESEKLASGHAERCAPGTGTALVSYSAIEAPTVRIVDPDTRTECPEGTTGEIWVHGGNVCLGYWEKPEATAATFGGTITDPTDGTPAGPWLRTGDLGFLSEGELFIVGRIKDLLIVYGRNHAPEDIEATVQSLSPGRTAAIAVAKNGIEELVVILEVRNTAVTDELEREKLLGVKRDIVAAISKNHGLSLADLVMAGPGAIPITTSGKIRRAACVDLYERNEFSRADI